MFVRPVSELLRKEKLQRFLLVRLHNFLEMVVTGIADTSPIGGNVLRPGIAPHHVPSSKHVEGPANFCKMTKQSILNHDVFLEIYSIRWQSSSCEASPWERLNYNPAWLNIAWMPFVWNVSYWCSFFLNHSVKLSWQL